MSDNVLRLMTVRDRARQQRDDAQQALRQAERQCAQTESQGAMLQSYREDTAVRWTRPQDRSTDRVQMGTAHHFLDRLDTALAQHTTHLQQAQLLVEQRRQALLAAETRLAALDKLIQRRQRQAQSQRDRREQLAIDQLAQRRLDPAALTTAHPWPSADDDLAHEPADLHAPRVPTLETPPCPH